MEGNQEARNIGGWFSKASRQNNNSNVLELFLEKDEVAILNSRGFHLSSVRILPFRRDKMD